MKKRYILLALAASLSALSYADQPVKVLHLSFDGDLSNSVAGGENGVLRGATTVSYEEGRFGQAVVFPAFTEEGAGNAIDVAHYAALKIDGAVTETTVENEDGTTTTNKTYVDPEGSFSISLWVKTKGEFNPSAKKAYVLYSGTWGSAKNAAGEAVQDGEEVRWTGVEFQGNADAVTKLVAGNKQPNSKKQEVIFTDEDGVAITSLLDGNWHHVVYVRDHEAQELRGYVDGKLATTIAIAKCYEYVMAHEAGLSIGNSRVASVNDELFVGSIDEVKIFKGVLSEENVAALFESNTDPGSTALDALSAGSFNVEVCGDELLLNAPSASAVAVYNVAGQMVLSQKVAGKASVAGVSKLTKGVYIVKVQTSEGVFSQKLYIK